MVVAHESLANFINLNITRPIIAKIHRGLYYEPFNTQAQTTGLSDGWQTTLKNLLLLYTPIVIGYGGGDRSLMSFLKDANTCVNGICWCYRNDGELSDEIKELVTRNNGNFIRIGGFDQLMFMLSRELGFDSPENEINEAAKDRIERYNKRYQEFSQEITQQTEKESASDEIAKDTKSAIDTFNAERLRRATERIEKEGTAENFFARGEIYIDAAMYREAIEDYTKAIELDSNYRSVYNNRGFVYTGLKEYEKAIADYKKAIELDKNIANPYGQIVQIVVESARER